jgi:hypothetical protein
LHDGLTSDGKKEERRVIPWIRRSALGGSDLAVQDQAKFSMYRDILAKFDLGSHAEASKGSIEVVIRRSHSLLPLGARSALGLLSREVQALIL